MKLNDEIKTGWPPSCCKVAHRSVLPPKQASAATAPGLDIGSFQKPPEVLAGHALGDHHCQILSLLVYALDGLINLLEGVLLCHGNVVSTQETLQT